MFANKHEIGCVNKFLLRRAFTIKTPYQPLYQNIYNDIKEKIETGELVKGERLATEYELMEQYSVSRITATRALQELAQNGYIQRFRSKGSFVTNVPEAISLPEQNDSLQRENTVMPNFHATIAMVMPFSSDTIPPLLSSMQQVAQEHNLMLSVFNSDRNILRERTILEQLLLTNIGGLICYPIQSHENIATYSRFLFSGIPVVSIDKMLPGLNVPFIKTDGLAATYDLVQYLIDRGHRRIAYYCHTLDDENENLRFRGYLKALISNGITPSESYFIELDKSSSSHAMLSENSSVSHTLVHQQLKNIMSLDKPPSALVCANDLIAAYVEQQAYALGISVPGQLSITGFDNLPLCNHLQVPLTSVAQDYQSIGRKAVELIQAIRRKEQVQDSYLFSAPICERKSVKDLNRLAKQA